MKKNILVIGSSKGIGKSVAEFFHNLGENVFCVSRTKSKIGTWIEADISTEDGIKKVVDFFKDKNLDALLFMGGTWEDGAFTSEYSFEKSSYQESLNVLAVNLIAPIELVKGLSSNLQISPNPRVVCIGSLSGLDNLASKEVANTASKFGLRGAIESLSMNLKKKGIGFSIINPANVATQEVLDDIKEQRFKKQVPIPIEDITSTINWILAVSKNVEVREVNLFQKY